MRIGIAIACALLVGVIPSAHSDAGVEPNEGPRRVLLLTGEDYPGHDWRATAPALRAAVEADPSLTVDVMDDLSFLASDEIHEYDSIIMHFKNYDPAVPGRAAFDNLVRFVDEGGGLTLVHFACGAFEEFRDDFADLAGRIWFGDTPPPGRAQHDPYGPFTVEIADHEHPITSGMADFETTDELYTCLEGDAPITVLATATSKLDGQAYPMAFTLEVGEGRVFHCVLGHDAAALSSEGVGELYRRGVAWTARTD